MGFEPTEPCGSTVFKTVTLDHSVTSPKITFILNALNPLEITAEREGFSPLTKAEGVGFEPTEPFKKVQRFSKPLRSATPASLRFGEGQALGSAIKPYNGLANRPVQPLRHLSVLMER